MGQQVVVARLLVAITLAMRTNGRTQPQKCCKVVGAEISALDSPQLP